MSAGVRDPIYAEVANQIGWKCSPLATAVTLSSESRKREKYLPARHLRLISDAIVEGVNGGGPRYIAVSMPPRFGKSWLISRFSPVWFLSNRPNKFVGVCGYGDRFASGWGREIRNLIRDHEERLGFNLAEDSQAAGLFHTAHGGGAWTAGIGGSATGRGADFLVIDDPCKSKAEAESPTYRDAVVSWFHSVARTRLHPGGVLLVVATRWHSEDLIGAILSGPDAAAWRVINLPAVWESDQPDEIGRRRGETLWPERFNPAEIDKTRRAVGEEVWASMFQQRPMDTTGIGSVYSSFEKHVNVRAVERDDRLALHWALDFNVDPMSSVLCQVHETFGPMAHLTNEVVRVVEVLEEISIPNGSTPAACNEFGERARAYRRSSTSWVARRTKVHVYGDASGERRNTAGAPSDWETVRRFFTDHAAEFEVHFHLSRSNPWVTDRVSSMNGALRNAAGQPRLFIDPRCKELIRDFEQVRWKRDSAGNALREISKADPRRSHLSDALGYLVHNLYGPSQFVGEVGGIVW